MENLRPIIIESSNNSLVFEYPLLMSQIKKVDQGKQIFSQQTQENYPNQNCPNTSPISSQHMPYDQKQEQQYILQRSIEEHSSIELDDEEQIDQDKLREIQILQHSIHEKLSEQYSMLKQKLKAKQKEKEDILRKYRQVSTIQPLGQRQLFQNNQQNMKKTQKRQKPNPLDSKKIKNKIFKNQPNSQDFNQTLRSQVSHSYRSENKQSYPIQNINHYHYTYILPAQSVPQPLTKVEQKKVIIHKMIDHSDLIKQMSEELKKMEFQRIEEMAKGKFSLKRKKQ